MKRSASYFCDLRAFPSEVAEGKSDLSQYYEEQAQLLFNRHPVLPRMLNDMRNIVGGPVVPVLDKKYNEYCLEFSLLPSEDEIISHLAGGDLPLKSILDIADDASKSTYASFLLNKLSLRKEFQDKEVNYLLNLILTTLGSDCKKIEFTNSSRNTGWLMLVKKLLMKVLSQKENFLEVLKLDIPNLSDLSEILSSMEPHDKLKTVSLGASKLNPADLINLSKNCKNLENLSINASGLVEDISSINKFKALKIFSFWAPGVEQTDLYNMLVQHCKHLSDIIVQKPNEITFKPDYKMHTVLFKTGYFANKFSARLVMPNQEHMVFLGPSHGMSSGALSELCRDSNVTSLTMSRCESKFCASLCQTMVRRSLESVSFSTLKDLFDLKSFFEVHTTLKRFTLWSKKSEVCDEDQDQRLLVRNKLSDICLQPALLACLVKFECAFTLTTFIPKDLLKTILSLEKVEEVVIANYVTTPTEIQNMAVEQQLKSKKHLKVLRVMEISTFDETNSAWNTYKTVKDLLDVLGYVIGNSPKLEMPEVTTNSNDDSLKFLPCSKYCAIYQMHNELCGFQISHV